MSTIQSQIRDHVQAGLQTNAFFKEQTHKEKNFFGFERTVRRLHLAVKDAQGQTVILDQKGIRLKNANSIFGQTFRSTAESCQHKEYRVNSTSLKHFLTRLEGKKVTCIKESNSKDALGERIFKAAGELLNAATYIKVNRVTFVHQKGKEEAKADRDPQIAELEKRQAELEHLIETSSTVADRLELNRVRCWLKKLNKTSASDVADHSDRDPQIAELEKRQAELEHLIETSPTVADRLELKRVQYELKKLNKTPASYVADAAD